MPRYGQFMVYGGQAPAREHTQIVNREGYQLSVRKTKIKNQWHLQFVRTMPEYDQPLVTEFFLTDTEMNLLRESIAPC